MKQLKYESTHEEIETADAYLIDDDFLVHQTWAMSAVFLGKTLRSFFSVEEFCAREKTLDRNVPVYVDLEFKDVASGADQSQVIELLGFKEIHLRSGRSLAALEAFRRPWIKSIGNKDSPWKPEINGLLGIHDPVMKFQKGS